MIGSKGGVALENRLSCRALRHAIQNDSDGDASPARAKLALANTGVGCQMLSPVNHILLVYLELVRLAAVFRTELIAATSASTPPLPQTPPAATGQTPYSRARTATARR